MANQKNLGTPTGLAPRWQLVRVTHGHPMRILGFWGLEGATGVRLQCFWTQKKGIYAHKHMQPKNKFFFYPNFSGSLIFYSGPLGVPGVPVVQWTWFYHPKLFFLTPLIPKVRHVVYCKYACIYKNQRWGSGDRAPYPDLGSNPFQNVDLI
jgi:hypothetical protein